jgi:mRNA-degrading endonuclease RelE of RelBE toxin-antitoxin system
MWRVDVSSRVFKDLRSLPVDVRLRFDRLLAEMEDGLAELNALPHFKRLLPSKDYGSFRPGINHRAGVFIDDESRTARIVAVGARENFYRRFLPP